MGKKKKSKFSPYGVLVLSADGKMTLFLPSGEVSTPLCPTFKQNTRIFLGGRGESPPSFLGVVFRLDRIDVLRKLSPCVNSGTEVYTSVVLKSRCLQSLWEFINK